MIAIRAIFKEGQFRQTSKHVFETKKEYISYNANSAHRCTVSYQYRQYFVSYTIARAE